MPNEAFKEILEQVKNDLRVWCGDPCGKAEEASEWNRFGWFREYLGMVFSENTLKKAEACLVGRISKGYNRNIYSNENGKNDFKTISYDRILADAIHAGPLRRYYFVCENEEFLPVTYNKIYPFQRAKDAEETQLRIEERAVKKKKTVSEEKKKRMATINKAKEKEDSRKVLTIEQFRDERAQDLATKHFLTGLKEMFTPVFEGMMDKGLICRRDSAKIGVWPV